MSRATGRAARSRAADAAGFTLLEILIALAIFGIGAVALLKAFSTELDRAGQGAHERAAMLLAQSRLDSVILTAPPSDRELTGETADGLRWRIEIRPYREPGAPANPVVALASVRVTVQWGDGHAVELSSLRLAPPPPSQ